MIDDGRDETELERADRNFAELLQELRVMQAGVQILFAFLLTVPLQARYGSLDGFQRGVLVATLLVLVAAIALLVAPVAWHRLMFRRQVKETVVIAASRLAQAGLGALGVAVACAMLLVLDLVLSRLFAVVLAAVVGGLLLVMWLVLPLIWRARLAAAVEG